GIHGVQEDASAHPQHGGGSRDGEQPEQFRHAFHHHFPQFSGCFQVSFSGHQHAHVVQFHNERDDAVHAHGNQHPDGGQREQFHPQRGAFDHREGERHDFRREDEIGFDRARHPFGFQFGGVFHVVGFGDRRVGVGGEGVPHFLRPFEAEVGSAQQQQHADARGQEQVQPDQQRQQQRLVF